MATPLKVTNLHKSYGAVEAVKGMSFELREGEIFGLLGPNGAGKTSIISCIVTLEKPTSGLVEVFGQDMSENPKNAKAKIGIVPQELIHHGFFTIEEILQFYSGYYGILNNKERIKFLLEKLGLYEHRNKNVRQLSGGMKRRLLVAKALVHNPRLLLLDEPTAGVDIELRSSLWEFVNELRKEGMTILLTTHYLEEAEELCDRVGIINFGKLVRIGGTSELVQQLTQREIEFTLLKDHEVSHKLLKERVGRHLKFVVPNVKSIGELFAEVNLDLNMISGLKIKEGRLEDAFRNLLESPHE